MPSAASTAHAGRTHDGSNALATVATPTSATSWKDHSSVTVAAARSASAKVEVAAKSDAIEVVENSGAVSWRACSFDTAAAVNSNAILKDVDKAAAFEITANSDANPNTIHSNNNGPPAR